VLLGQYGKDAFLRMRFVREDSHWKIRDQVFSDKAYPAESVYAVIPPAAGAFDRAGAPWQNVATAFSQAEVPPMGWPVMKIAVSGVGEFALHASANIGDDATFEENGRANDHRHYVAYWLLLERANRMIFQTWAGLHPDPLIQAAGNALDLRVPLRAMGIADSRQTKIVIGDAQGPKSAIFSLEAQQYR
jgi:hypothetical protein